MTYDALLAARRGLGADELARIEPDFAAAVRWALFAERAAPDLLALRRIATAETPKDLTGADLTGFMAERAHARELLQRRESAFFPKDEDDG